MASRPDRSIEPHPVRVLVVDDDQHVRRFTSLMLGLEGFEVVEAGGGLEARRLFEAEPVDVVVTDLYMPGENGAELVGDLRLRDRNLPIVIVSGVGSTDAALTGAVRELGDVEAVYKPFSSDALVAAIRRALGGRS
jgi:two-component system, NtrC family, C4-dicarboxylate transport response regulator DctD